MDIYQALQVCIKFIRYINTYFLYLNEPDKAWSITMLIVCVYAHINSVIELQMMAVFLFKLCQKVYYFYINR